MKIEGDNKYWELDECLRQYFRTDTGNAIRKNLEFFIPLRNQVEHRSMPELDASIFGECQAMLLNFDDVLAKEFGEKYRLRESLSFSLQLFPSSESLGQAVKRSRASERILDFIQRYRSTISPEVLATGKYSFKAFLIQVANHKSEQALPIQFVHYDKLSKEEREQVSRFVTMVKFKEVPMSNLGLMKASEVAKKVQQALGNPKIQRGDRQIDRFNVGVHSACWKKYGARPAASDPHPEKTDYRYCIYDKMHNDYGYTQAWVEFLTEKLRDKDEFDSLYESPPVTV